MKTGETSVSARPLCLLTGAGPWGSPLLQAAREGRSSTRLSLGGQKALRAWDIAGFRRNSKPDACLPGAGQAAAVQWLVPSDLVILFQTLYLPTGFRMGSRFTSLRVAAS